MNYMGLLITNKTNVHWDSYYEMYMPFCFHLLIHKDKQKNYLQHKNHEVAY